MENKEELLRCRKLISWISDHFHEMKDKDGQNIEVFLSAEGKSLIMKITAGLSAYLPSILEIQLLIAWIALMTTIDPNLTGTDFGIVTKEKA